MFKTMFKLLSWIILLALVAAFFIIPNTIYRDYFLTSDTIHINQYEILVFDEMKKMDVTDMWLKNDETPDSYQTNYKEETNAKALVRLGASDEQQITFRYTLDKDDPRLKYLNYRITNSRSGINKSFAVTLYPSDDYLRAAIAKLNINYNVNFEKAGFFEKTIGKWRYIIFGDKLLLKELHDISNALKKHIEDSHGRLLNIPE